MKISFDTRMNSPVWQAVAVAIASAVILSGYPAGYSRG